ncbi:2896_t:CDS:2, partial [Cetraspora pellucida]
IIPIENQENSSSNNQENPSSNNQENPSSNNQENPSSNNQEIPSSNNQEMTTQNSLAGLPPRSQDILRRLRRFQQRRNTPNEELRRQLKKTILYGTFTGIVVSLILGVLFVGVFYAITKDSQNGNGEHLWEAISALLATVLITLIAWYMVRVSVWKEKLETRIKHTTLTYLEKYASGNKWFLFFLPLTIIMREALESFIFIFGSFNQDYLRLLISALIGAALVAAGLFGSAIYNFELATNSNRTYLWNLNCCDPKTEEGWKIMEGFFGWTNKASLAQVIGYVVYWVVVLLRTFIILRNQKKTEVMDTNDSAA